MGACHREDPMGNSKLHAGTFLSAKPMKLKCLQMKNGPRNHICNHL